MVRWAFVLSLYLGMVSSTLALSLSLVPDRVKISLQQTLSLDFVFEGLSQRPVLSGLDIEGFQILGSSTSSSIRIVNGQKSESFTIRYQLKPKREGELVIGPYQVQVGNETLQSNIVRIQVTEQVPEGQSPEPVFARASVPVTSVYAGDQTVYELKIYRPRQGANVGRIGYNAPGFEDLIVDSQASTQSEAHETVDGVVYLVTTIRIPLFTVRPGKVKINPSGVSYVVRQSGRRGLFDDFFQDDFFGGLSAGGEQRQTFSNEVQFDVLPLPGKQDVLVGRYALSARLSQSELKVGENLTLTLELTGTGSLQDWKSPEVQIDSFRVYADGEGQFEKKRTREGEIGGIKSYQFALVPVRSGEYRIGPFELEYFDPKLNTYVKTATDALQIKVTAGTGQESPPPTPGHSVKHTSEQPTEQVEQLPASLQWLRRSSWVKPVLLLCLISLTCAWLILGLKKIKSQLNRGVIARFNYALRSTDSPMQAAIYALEIWPEFQERKLSAEEFLQILSQINVQTDLLERIRVLLESEQAYRFAGIGSIPDPDLWRSALKELVAGRPQ